MKLDHWSPEAEAASAAPEIANPESQISNLKSEISDLKSPTPARRTLIAAAAASILALGLLLASARAADPATAPAAAPVLVDFAGPVVTGGEARVPVADRPSIVMFVRADQPLSHQALRQAQAVLKDPAAAQVVLILSGPAAPQHARGMIESYKYPWPIVTDPDYALSGKLNVHVWPTTVIIDRRGVQLAHLAGLNRAFAASLEAYVDFARGKLDDAALQQRLTTHPVVGDTTDLAAGRHLQVAARLIEKGRLDEARAELATAARLDPKDPAVRWSLAKALAQTGQAREALGLLDRLPAGVAPAREVDLIRAKALIAREQWTQARELLPAVVKTNPTLAEAHYLLGLVYQHDKDPARAAESFRAAYEAAAAAKSTAP